MKIRQTYKISIQIRSKKSLKQFFVSKLLLSISSPRLKKFRWPVMVVKPRKEPKNIKKLWKQLQILTESCLKSRH